MCEQGILHRDISAGNILLSSLDSKGFLTDLEFAQFDSETVVVKTTTRVEPIARHSGSSNFTEAATRTHTKFDVVVPRGAAISVRRYTLSSHNHTNLSCSPTGHRPVHGLRNLGRSDVQPAGHA